MRVPSGSLQVASVPGAGRTLRSLGTGVLWFHLLHSVIVDVDFFFFSFSLHKKSEIPSFVITINFVPHLCI